MSARTIISLLEVGIQSPVRCSETHGVALHVWTVDTPSSSNQRWKRPEGLNRAGTVDEDGGQF